MAASAGAPRRCRIRHASTAGDIRSTAGTPLANVWLYFRDSGGNWAGSASTDASGNYVSGGLSSGTYYVRTYNCLGYLDEVYDDVSCPGGSCSSTTGTPVSVTAPSTTAGIDFVLAPGGRVAGRITDASGAPLANVSVQFYDSAGAFRGSGYTDASGVYTSTGMPSGTYYARTSNSSGYFDELYDDIPCPAGSCSLTAGTPIAVTVPNTTTGVNFALAPGGRISGTIKSAAGAPLANVDRVRQQRSRSPGGVREHRRLRPLCHLGRSALRDVLREDGQLPGLRRRSLR